MHQRVEHHRGGPTDLDDLAFVCQRHHEMPEAGWVLEREPVVPGASILRPPAQKGRAPP